MQLIDKTQLFTEILKARQNLRDLVINTQTSYNINLSVEFDASIYLKREDMQVVRSYKLRGAYNKIKSLEKSQRAGGVICASAGNHAQGVAYSCYLLGITAKIYMPLSTPVQKVKKVKAFGKNKIEIILQGETYDDAYKLAKEEATQTGKVFIHPFDDYKVIAGQGTMGLEIIDALKTTIDYVFVPIGGGGLASGIITTFSSLSPLTKIIGVEPAGAAAMKLSVEKGVNTTLEAIDGFVDGAAVKRVGDYTFSICKEGLHDIVVVPEGKVCSTILRLYNEEAIVAEPAGALSIAALDFYKDKIKDKVAVCIVSGGNNDMTRAEEIKERSLSYEGLSHYFKIQFYQRPGSLKEFVTDVLGQDDDLTYFQFTQKNKRERGPAVVGVQLKRKEDFQRIIGKLNANKYNYTYMVDHADIY